MRGVPKILIVLLLAQAVSAFPFDLKGQDMKEPRQSRRLTGSTSEIAVSPGSFPNEVSWTFACPSGSSASGGAPFSGSLSATSGEKCTLTMADSFGDGWNGASWTGFEQSFMMFDGQSMVETFQIPAYPPPPPLPPPFLFPPLLPGGLLVMATAQQLRETIEALSPHFPPTLLLPDGAHFFLKDIWPPLGLVVNSRIVLTGEGRGASLDAGKQGRFFSLLSGANLTMNNVALVNGSAQVIPELRITCSLKELHYPQY